MTNHTCKFCGTVASPGQNCSSLEQAWLSTPSRPYGCQWFDAESRKLHPRPLADAAQGTGKLLADLDNLRKKIAAEIVEANDCGETIYAEALCEMDELFARCETALAAQPPAAPVDGWVHLKAKRVLSVDRGQTTVLCDRDIPTELLILVGSASPAAPVEREPIVCDKCNEVMAAAVGLPVSDQRSSAGSEGEPFMMLSCREAKQCLHNIPGCICDGDPTNG